MPIPVVTNTYWPVEPDIDLRDDWLKLQDLLPKIRETRVVHITQQTDLEKNQEVYLLWKPPHSALNGWSDQPSEIVQSQIVYGSIFRQDIRTVADSFTLNIIEMAVGRSHEYQVIIKDVIPFLQFCLSYTKIEDFKFLNFTDLDHQTYNIWQKVQWCGKFETEDLIYLQASHYESHFEALFAKIDGLLWLKMHEHSGASFCDWHVTNYPLNQVEQQIFEKILEKAVVLEDSAKPYLIL